MIAASWNSIVCSFLLTTANTRLYVFSLSLFLFSVSFFHFSAAGARVWPTCSRLRRRRQPRRRRKRRRLRHVFNCGQYLCAYFNHLAFSPDTASIFG
jgi:hypothetical protein